MFQAKDIPAGLPDEVKQLLGRIQSEPPALLDQRQSLLLQLETQGRTASGTQKDVMSALHAVLRAISSPPSAQLEAQREFTRALERYAKESTPPRPLPAVVLAGIGYLRDRVQAMGLGDVLEKVQGAALRRTP